MAKQRKTKKIKDVEVVEEKDVVEEIDEVEEELEEEPKKNKKEAEEVAPKEDGFFRGVRKEMKKVVWPKAGEVAKNTFAVIIFCAILIAFFTVVVLGVSYLKELFS